MRVLFWVILTVAVAAFAYLGSFYGAKSVFAHGAHCGGNNPPCNTGDQRYLAGQTGNSSLFAGYSHGIQGHVVVKDVALKDIQCNSPGTSNPKCDMIANDLEMYTTQGWAQVGFVEGAMPDFTSRASPVIYTENGLGCWGYDFREWGPAPPHEFMQIDWKGESRSDICPGRLVYKWWFGRGINFAPFHYAFLETALATFAAATEHFDNTHMEPNGKQCFGQENCDPNYFPYAFFLWNRDTGYWTLWDTSRPTIIRENENSSGYFHNPIEYWWAFSTTGRW